MSKTVINRAKRRVHASKATEAEMFTRVGIPGSWTDCQRAHATEDEKLWLDK